MQIFSGNYLCQIEIYHIRLMISSPKKNAEKRLLFILLLFYKKEGVSSFEAWERAFESQL